MNAMNAKEVLNQIVGYINQNENISYSELDSYCNSIRGEGSIEDRYTSSIIKIGAFEVRVAVFPMRYSNKPYTGDVADIVAVISYEDPIMVRKINEVVSPTALEVAMIGDVSSSDKIRLIKKYNINLEKGEMLWISNRGTCFAGSRPVKPGKFLREINPYLETGIIDEIINNLKMRSFEVSKHLEMGEVSEIYGREDVKISSCMIGQDVSIYNKMDVKCLALNLKGIVARTLIYEEKYFSMVYATNTALEVAFIDYLKKNYKEIPADYRTKVITGEPKDYFIPYMDQANRCVVTHKGFYFTKDKSIESIGSAINTNGFLRGIHDE